MTDTISSDDRGADWVPRRPVNPLSVGGRMTALTTAVSLVLVGGIATVAVRSAGGSGDPAQVVPASAFAYGELDLSLPDGQADALSHLLAQFPAAPHGSGSVRDRVLGAIFADSTDPHIDYRSSVKPWLGDKVAVAGWLDSTGQPQVEFVLASTDDAAARRTVHHVSPDEGLAFSHGYAVLASTQALADEAVRAAGRSALASRETFTSDVAALPGSPAGTGWLDGAGMRQAIRGDMAVGSNDDGSSVGGLDPLLGLGPMTGGVGDLKGRAAIGIRVEDGAVQLDMVERGSSLTAKGTSSDRIRHLPGATFAAVEIHDPAGLVRQLTTMASGVFGMLLAGPRLSATDCESFSSTVTIAPGGSTSSPTPPPAPAMDICPPPSPTPDPLAELSAATGLRLPDDLTTLLGSAAVVSYGGITPGGVPKIAIRSRPADLNAAADVVSKLRTTLGDHSDIGLSERTAGSDLVVATSDEYADAVAGTGDLGTQATFTDAMRGLPDSMTFAAYVDLGSLLPLLTHGRAPQLDALSAVGMWTATGNGTATARIRLIVR